MICDLCHEDSNAAERCDHCGHRMRVRPASPRQEVPGPFPPRGRRDFGAEMAPLRARHRAELAALAQWTLGEGRPHDADVAALCLDVLDDQRGDGGVRLDRRDVTWMLHGRLRNRASMADTQLPDHWITEVWNVLRFLAVTGRLDPASDPEAALLEPLQCYGGLGADGSPRPEGVDVEFPCQCHLPHDPACPPGLAQHLVGRDRDDGTEFVVHAHVRNRSEDLPMSAFLPLTKLARRLRARNSVFIVALDQFDHVGTVPPTRTTPELWIYRFHPEARRGFDPLVLDEHGNAVEATRNRSYKVGFRWMPIEDRRAIVVCGLASWTFERPAPGERPDDAEPEVRGGVTAAPDDASSR